MQKGCFQLLNSITDRTVSSRVMLFFLSLLLFYMIFYSSLTYAQIYPIIGYPFPIYQRSVPGEVLIRFKTGTPTARIAEVLQRYGLLQISGSPFSGLRRTAATAGVSGELIQFLFQEPQVAYVESNFIRRANQFIPNDPLYEYQWHLQINDLPLAWELSTGEGVIVAVLDTGAAYENYLNYLLAPDLANTSFLPGFDFVNDDYHPNDDNRHGTHITGIIAQSTHNQLGGAGVAFNSTILPVKVLDSSGSGDVSTIVNGIYWAVNNGAQIINLSFGSVGDPSAAEEEAINYAIEQGVVVMCSAGNEATNEAHFPSSYPASISVSATRFDNQFADAYSNYGPDINLAAPGGDLSLDQDGDGSPDGIYQQTYASSNLKSFDYLYAEGTSSACAYVSGVAALVLSRGMGNLTGLQVREILEGTAIDAGLPGWDELYGWGIVNPFAALLAVDALLGTPPVPAAVTEGFFRPFAVDPLLQAYSPLGLADLNLAARSSASSFFPVANLANTLSFLNPFSFLTTDINKTTSRTSATAFQQSSGSFRSLGLGALNLYSELLFNPFSSFGIGDTLRYSQSSIINNRFSLNNMYNTFGPGLSLAPAPYLLFPWFF